MTSFPSCPSLDYLTCSSHYTFPILHLITPLKHAHPITQSLHISLHDSIFVSHCHFISAFYYIKTKFPLYLTYFENLYTLPSFFYASNYTASPSYDQLITLFLLPISFQPWRMPILQETSWDNSLSHLTYSLHYNFLTYMSYYIELLMNLIKTLEGTYLTTRIHHMHPAPIPQIHISLKYFFLLF